MNNDDKMMMVRREGGNKEINCRGFSLLALEFLTSGKHFACHITGLHITHCSFD